MHRWAVVGALVAATASVAATGGGPVRSLARFSSAAKVSGNQFTAAPDWTPPTVTSFTVALASDTRSSGAIRRGSSFYVYANLVDTGAPASGVASVSVDIHTVVSGATAVPLVAGTYIAPGGASFAYRTALQVSDGTLASSSYAVSVRAVDQAGNVGLTPESVPVSSTYVFEGSANHITGQCPAATGGQYDMELGHVPAGPEQSRTGPGPRDVVTFCSDTFTAGSQIPAGTTVVSLSYQNTLSKACNVTATLWRGSTSLGALTRTIAANTSRTSGTWSFATAASTFAAGDRLSVTVEYQAGNLCNGATFWWDSAAAPSSVSTP